MSAFSITGYESFYKNRAHKKGGKVICYVKNTLTVVKLEKLEPEKYDSVYVDITTERNKKLTTGTVYRPAKLQTADDTALYEEINSTIQNKEAIIIGDFNCPNVDWNLMHGDPEGNRLVEMVEDAFLTQIVNQPTRENNIPDLVLATDPDLISNCEVGEKLNGCDHHLICFNVKTELNLTNNMASVPDYKKANFNRARELIPHTVWERPANSPIDYEWNSFKDKLLEVERMTVPMKTKRASGVTQPPWMTTEVKRAINLKKRHYMLMKREATAETREQDRRSLRTCRTLIRKCKRDHKKRTARKAKTNPKKFFTYVRAKKSIKSNIGLIANENGVLTQDSGQMAEILNTNLASVFTIQNLDTVPECPTSPIEITPLKNDNIPKEEVQKYLDKLQVNKSKGPDNLSPN